jgi:hypothetical protein
MGGLMRFFSWPRKRQQEEKFVNLFRLDLRSKGEVRGETMQQPDDPVKTEWIDVPAAPAPPVAKA